MAARLLCVSITRSALLNYVRVPALTQRCLVEWPVHPDGNGTRTLLDTRALHTKVFDKEANWSAQRSANQPRFQEPFNSLGPAELNNDKSTTNSVNSNSVSGFRTQPVEIESNFEVDEDADVFGGARINEAPDKGDLIEEEYISNPQAKSQKLSHIQYIRLIKEQLKAKQLQGAIDILEKQMKKDRVKPETFTYNLLISGCAKFGYTRKAFSLFTKMRQRGLRVTGGTYTSLFNACANAPSEADGISRANHVREIMLEKGVEPNLKNYNAMIKAYGRWGDVKTAYQLADEMKEKHIYPTVETFNFLLQACASDTKFGFRHCLLTWHKMLKSGFKPDYYSFNTVLRCVRDCGFGDIETMQEVLKQILDESAVNKLTSNNDSNTVTTKLLLSDAEKKTDSKEKNTAKPESTIKTLSHNPFRTVENESVTNSLAKESLELSKPDNSTKLTTCNPFKDTNSNFSKQQDVNKLSSETVAEVSFEVNNTLKDTDNNLPKQQGLNELSSKTVSTVSFEVPNLLSPQPHLGSMLALAEITNPHDRFLLLGGLTGFLEQMKQNNITPNIQMFTMMLEVIPPTNSAEKQVLTFIRRIGLKADIDFFNILIKKRSLRFDYEGAKEVISMISTAGLHPDIVTYGVLALGCRTQEEARELLQEMRNNDIRINIQILGAMLRQGCSQRTIPYICEIMQISLDEHIKPNDFFLRHLNDFYTKCARLIDARHPSTKTKNFKKQHARFCDKLRLYHEEHGIAGLKLSDAIRVIKEGPYQQYKDAKVEGLEPEKNEALIRKQKIRKYIKKIKIAHLKGDETISEKPEHPAAESFQKSLIS